MSPHDSIRSGGFGSCCRGAVPGIRARGRTRLEGGVAGTGGVRSGCGRFDPADQGVVATGNSRARSGRGRFGIRGPGGAVAGRRRGPRSRPRSQGFTLLETMVALVIFTGAALALYALFNTNLVALARAHDVSRQVPAVRHAVEHLASINPREESDGRIELDGLDVAWTATLMQPPRQSQTLTGGLGYYEIGLYEIEFTLSDGDRTLGTWRMRSVGYEKVREPEL